MEIGFTGTQEGLTDQQKRTLEERVGRFYLDGPFGIVHHGMCVGADTQFHAIIRTLLAHVKIIGHPGFKEGHPKRAILDVDEIMPVPKGGPLARNVDIAVESDWLFACPKEMKEVLRSGTWATVRYARKAEHSLTIIYPDGSYDHEIS